MFKINSTTSTDERRTYFDISAEQTGSGRYHVALIGKDEKRNPDSALTGDFEGPRAAFAAHAHLLSQYPNAGVFASEARQYDMGAD
jgi:hypothetical protein